MNCFYSIWRKIPCVRIIPIFGSVRQISLRDPKSEQLFWHKSCVASGYSFRTMLWKELTFRKMLTTDSLTGFKWYLPEPWNIALTEFHKQFEARVTTTQNGPITGLHPVGWRVKFMLGHGGGEGHFWARRWLQEKKEREFTKCLFCAWPC